MGISGSDKALMYAQAGVARFGATRFDYHSARWFVSIGGTQRRTSVLQGTLVIEDALNEEPNHLLMSLKGLTPTKGQEVIVTLGSENNVGRIFAGQILSVRTRYDGRLANIVRDIRASDYTYLLNRRIVRARYTSESGTAIVHDLIDTFTTGFTSAHVATGLASIDEITFTEETVSGALTRLANRLGGYWYVDYHKDIHLWVGSESGITDPVAITSSTVYPSFKDFTWDDDLSGVITRVLVEGYGSTAYAAAAVGDTSLSVVDSVFYNAAGGTVVSGPQRITYTAIGSDVHHNPTWLTRQAPLATASGGWNRVVWADALTLFVAVGHDGASTAWVMTSPDGVTWTSRTPSEHNAWFGVAWSPSLSLFAAVSLAGTNRVMTSPDGITWTNRTAAAAQTWRSVAWAPSVGLFAAVHFDGGTSGVMTSPDGITWTTRTTPAASWWDVCWSPEQTLFVAVGASGGVMTSPDGVTWTSRTAAAGNTWRGVIWATAPALFVAVSSDGTNRVMTSPDGVTWTSRTAAEQNQWLGVTYSADERLLVAVSDSGTNRVMISEDGVTWTAEAAATQNEWHSVAWAASVQRYVAVGGVGATRVMTTEPSSVTGKLTGIPATGTGAITAAIAEGDEVNILVTVNDTSAQTALAALIGGDGIHEEYVQDRRLSEAEATARGTALLALTSTAAVSAHYKSKDKRIRSGREATITSVNGLTGDLRIQRARWSGFGEGAAEWPTIEVEASTAKFTLQDLLRQARQQVEGITT